LAVKFTPPPSQNPGTHRSDFEIAPFLAKLTVYIPHLYEIREKQINIIPPCFVDLFFSFSSQSSRKKNFLNTGVAIGTSHAADQIDERNPRSNFGDDRGGQLNKLGQTNNPDGAGIRLCKDNEAIVYPAEGGRELIIEKAIVINQHPTGIKYIGNHRKMISIQENGSHITKALSIGWRYEKMSRGSLSIKKIAKAEKMAKRTIYRYLNLNFLSPNIVNDIMDGRIPPHINLQTLLKFASRYPDFNDQERVFYNI